jgi:hypothetical protein
MVSGDCGIGVQAPPAHALFVIKPPRQHTQAPRPTLSLHHETRPHAAAVERNAPVDMEGRAGAPQAVSQLQRIRRQAASRLRLEA